jgi:hypothetical protein
MPASNRGFPLGDIVVHSQDIAKNDMGFEDRRGQLPGPRPQRSVRPVAAKIDHAVANLGDDAGGWFLVGLVADP